MQVPFWLGLRRQLQASRNQFVCTYDGSQHGVYIYRNVSLSLYIYIYAYLYLVMYTHIHIYIYAYAYR